MKDRKQKTIALVAMIVAVVGLSVGFAAFSNNLLIKSRVSVNPDSSKFGVVFSTSSTSEVTNAVIPTKNPTSITATDGSIDNSTTPTISNLSATFTSPGQSATYSFYAYNKGEYLAYLNSITFLGSKTCTAGTGTTQSLVDEACNNISVTVQIGSISTSATKTNITGETIAAGVGKPVTVTLKYEGTARADGPFEVEFGDISMYFASVTGINEGTSTSGGCEIVSGDINTVGSEIACGSEHFYVMPDHELAGENTISMLAAKNITLPTGVTTSSISEYPVQSDETGVIDFSDTNYWGNVSDGTFVYNSNSLIYPYLEAYKQTLIGLGLSSDIEVTLASYQQLTDESIGCEEHGGCTASFIDKGQNWWTGSAGDHDDSDVVWFVGSDSYFVITDYNDVDNGARPVVIIPESEIG